MYFTHEDFCSSAQFNVLSNAVNVINNYAPIWDWRILKSKVYQVWLHMIIADPCVRSDLWMFYPKRVKQVQL